MNAWVNTRRGKQLTGLPGQLQPDDDVGLFIAGVLSGQRLEQRIDALQVAGFAPLAPVEGNHLLVGVDLVDVGRQRRKIRQQLFISAGFLPLVDPNPRFQLPITPQRRRAAPPLAVIPLTDASALMVSTA